MFTVDTTISDLKVKDKSIAKLSFSMNSPHIATPELSTEAARCYIIVFKEDGQYRAHVGLYLPASDRKFYYSYSDNPFGEDALPAVLEEAAVFSEGMGFMLDELNIATMSSDERNQWIESQDIFGYRAKPEAKVEPQPVAAPAVPEPPTAQAPPAPIAPAPVAVPSIAPDAAPVAPPAVEMKPSHPVLPPEQEDLPDEESDEEEAELPPPPQPKTRPKHAKKTAPVRLAEAPREPADEAAGADGQELAAEQAPAPPKKPARPPGKQLIDPKTGTVNREYEALVRLLASF